MLPVSHCVVIRRIGVNSNSRLSYGRVLGAVPRSAIKPSGVIGNSSDFESGILRSSRSPADI